MEWILNLGKYKSYLLEMYEHREGRDSEIRNSNRASRLLIPYLSSWTSLLVQEVFFSMRGHSRKPSIAISYLFSKDKGWGWVGGFASFLILFLQWILSKKKAWLLGLGPLLWLCPLLSYCLIGLFWDKVSLHSPSCPGTCSNSCASVSWMLVLQACVPKQHVQ